MYIINPSKITKKYQCKIHTYKYLIAQGIPLLSRDGSAYYFSDTKILREHLNNVPFVAKMLDALTLEY